MSQVQFSFKRAFGTYVTRQPTAKKSYTCILYVCFRFVLVKMIQENKMSFFHEKSSVFTKYHHIKSVCFVHSKNRPKIRKPLVHTFSYISKRTVKKIIFYIHMVCSSQTCPLAWWSLREMVGSRHTGITSLLQWFTADCLRVVLHPWVLKCCSVW